MKVAEVHQERAQHRGRRRPAGRSARSELPPGPGIPAPILLAKLKRDPIGFSQRCHAHYGPIFSLRMGILGQAVVLGDAASARDVFTADPATFGARANLIAALFPSGGALMTLDGDEHLRRRRLLLPAFHGERVTAWRGRVEAVARAGIASWPRDRPIKACEALRAIALDAILAVLVGD